MQFKYRLPLVLAVLVALPCNRVWAQADDEDEDDFGSFGFFATSPKSIGVSLKFTQGAQVKFSELGTVKQPFDYSNGDTLGRNYMDGGVQIDERRRSDNGSSSELDENGGVLYPSGDRYKLYNTAGDPNSGVFGDYLAYTPDRTRYWQYNNASQAVEKNSTKYIAFHNYSARSQGATLLGNRGINGGVEIEVSHAVTDPTKRIRLSLTAGMALSGIYSDKTGKVKSTLVTYTDYYRYFPYAGTDAPYDTAPTGSDPYPYRYRGPSNLNTKDANGVYTETTTALSDSPDLHEADENQLDGAEVDGVWRVRGAYFVFKFGPQLNAMLTESLSIRASVGVAGTYASTRYSATESFKVEGVNDPLTGLNSPISVEPESSTKTILLPGYYANFDATWAVNERTDVFAGVTYENLGQYNQRLEDRKANIDLSSTAGVRGGLSFKF